MNYIDQYKGLPRQVYVLCATRAILGVSMMSFSISTLLMRSILGMDELSIGFIVAGQAVIAVIFSVLGGRLADIYGRKKISIGSFAVLCVCLAVSSFVCRTKWIIPMLFLNNAFSSAAYPGQSAMVADALRDTGRKEGFSLLYLAHNFGIAFGPSLGGLLFYNHLVMVFWIQIILIIAACLVFGLLTKDSYDPSVAAQKKDGADAAKAADAGESLAHVILSRPVLLVYFAVMIIITMAYMMVGYMLNLQMNDTFGLQIAARYSGFVWTANAITIVTCTPLITARVKKLHQFQKMVIGCIFYAVGFGAYVFLKAPWMVLAFAVVWSLGEIIISTDSSGFIAENSPESHVARCQSLYETSRSVGRAIAPPLFGWMLGFMSYSNAWEINAFVCVLLSVFMFIAWNRLVKKA